MRKVDETFICDICEESMLKSSYDATSGRIMMIRVDVYGKNDHGGITIHICNACSPKIGIQKGSEFGHQVSKDFIVFLKQAVAKEGE